MGLELLMVSNSSSENYVKPSSLTTSEIDEILSKTLIANLATLGQNDSIHIIPMRFIRIGNDICIPTSPNTRKYKNLKFRPYASVMIDISRVGLDLKGVLIKGRIELVEGKKRERLIIKSI